MHKKRIVYFLMASLLPLGASAQFAVGNTGMYINSGTLVAIDSLTMQPTSSLNISGNSLSVSHVAIQGNPYSSVLRVYQWASPLSMDGLIGFHYDNSELNGNISSQLVLKYSSTMPVDSLETIAGSVAGSSSVSATLASPLQIMRLTAVSGGSVLPISLLSFDAKLIGDNIGLLEWATATEKDFSHFIVERSNDAMSFQSLGTVSSKANNGTSHENLYYQFTDRNMMNGNNFYRLTMIDKSGTKTYSELKLLRISNQNQSIVVYPIPAKESVFIDYNGNEGVDIALRLCDIYGRVLKTEVKSVTMFNHWQISLSEFPSGNYILQLVDGESNNPKVFKIVKE